MKDGISLKVQALYGPPGCGKGDLIKEIFPNCNGKEEVLFTSDGRTGAICLGNIFRRKVAEQTLPHAEAERMANGKLISDEYTAEIVSEYILKILGETGKKLLYIFIDGFPRNAVQIALFAKVLANIRATGNIFYVDVPKNVCIERIMTGKRGRADDTIDVVTQRHVEWQENHVGVSAMFGKKSAIQNPVWHVIETSTGKDSPGQVWEKIRSRM